jgi:tetratricopeptide (TPR) repeat protein
VFVARAIRSIVVVALPLLGGAAPAAEVRDLHFGEALFYAKQEHYFEALERLDAEIAQHRGVDEPELDSLYPHIDHAEFSVGDFELRYRMHHRAGRAITAVLEGDVPETVRNDAAYRLARIHFQKNRPEAALVALARIEGRVPEAIRDDIEFLRANLYLATGRASEAVEVLGGLQGAGELAGFSAYNLGIALLRDGEEEQAARQLDRAGRVRGSDPSTLAIRDKSNLVLGTMLLDASAFEAAQATLDRVRLEGPFSNSALLRAGWADASADRFERALVPWSLLVERDSTDVAVQESLLALPYAYSQVEVHGRAAVLYGRAVEVFGGELAKVDASIRSIRDGEFLRALAREEIRRDSDWVIRLRSLPDAPETFYLLALMASHDFQTGLQNYLDLEDLQRKLRGWQRSLGAFEDILDRRRAYYEPRLPEIDRAFRKLDSRIRLRLEQREHLKKRLDEMLIAPRPDHLATGSEQQAVASLDRLEERLAGAPAGERERLRARVERLRGVISWAVETGYHQRLTDVHAHLRALSGDIEALNDRYDAFVRTRQAATHSYVGYEIPINGLRTRVGEALEGVDRLMARQGHLLETVAVEELLVRRNRLEEYQDQARFAFADSYDRAAKAQAR